MGLGHLLGLDDGGERWLCGDCGRVVVVDGGDDGAADTDAAGGDGPTCPHCGSEDLERLLVM